MTSAATSSSTSSATKQEKEETLTLPWSSMNLNQTFALFYAMTVGAKCDCVLVAKLYAFNDMFSSDGVDAELETRKFDDSERVFIRLYLDNAGDPSSHAGLLIIDRKAKRYFVFDSRGREWHLKTYAFQHQSIKDWVEKVAPGYSEVSDEASCPVAQRQQGFCALFAAWWLYEQLLRGKDAAPLQATEFLPRLKEFYAQMMKFRNDLLRSMFANDDAKVQWFNDIVFSDDETKAQEKRFQDAKEKVEKRLETLINEFIETSNRCASSSSRRKRAKR